MMLPMGLFSPIVNFLGKYGLILGLLGVAALGLYGKGRVDGGAAMSEKLNKQIGTLQAALEVEKASLKQALAALDKQNAAVEQAHKDSEARKADIEAAKKEAEVAIKAFGEKAKTLENIIKDQSRKTPEQQCADATKALDDYVKDGGRK